MGRPTNAERARRAEEAAKAASEAGRTLQARRSEPEPESESRREPDPRLADLPRGNPEREAVFDEIVARRDKESGLSEELKDEPATELPETPKAEEPKPEETPAEAPAAEVAPEAVAPTVEQPTTIETVKVKVDGEEFLVPKTEVDEAGGIAAYQRDKASEKRFKQSNEALAEAKRIAAWFAQQQQAKAEPEKPKVSDQEFLMSKMDVIRFGTPEEGAAALREVMERSTTRIDPNSIIEQATAKIRHDAAVSDFDKEFSDLVTNPVLLKAIVAIRNERIEQHQKARQPIADWATFYRQIGNEVRTAVGGRPHQSTATPATAAATAPTGTTSQVSDKEARKSSIVNLPTAGSRAAPAEVQKPESREDIIKDMRKSRGLHVD